MLVRSLVGESGTTANYEAGKIRDLDDTVAAARIAAGLAEVPAHGSLSVTDGSTTVSAATALTFTGGTVTDLGSGGVQVVGSTGAKGDKGDTGAAGTFSNAAPANATATGVQGTVAWDSGFIYVCVATNTWKRVAIATWP